MSLTEERIKGLARDIGIPFSNHSEFSDFRNDDVILLCRAIEAAVREEQAGEIARLHGWVNEVEQRLAIAERRSYPHECIKLRDELRNVGAMIPMAGGGTFVNDPPDAIVDALARYLNSLREANAELVKYADHFDNCRGTPFKECTCGLDDLIAKHGGK